MNTIILQWLIDEGVTQDVIEQFGIAIEDNVTFPVHDVDGTFLFNKYRRNPLEEEDGSPKYTYDRGGVVTLYGMNHALESENLLITEGEKDCLVAWSNNIPAVTSTGGALSFQQKWVDDLHGRTITVCFDNDKTGGEGMAKLARMFGIENLSFVFIPDRGGVKDITDYVRAGGNLHELMKTAMRFGGIDDVKSDQAKRLAIYQSTHFHSAYIRQTREAERIRATKTRVSPEADDVERARSVPMTDYIEFGRNHKACCPWHKEKTPSLHYYPKNNTAYCFGACARAYDVIDAVMLAEGCDFKQALRKLI